MAEERVWLLVNASSTAYNISPLALLAGLSTLPIGTAGAFQCLPNKTGRYTSSVSSTSRQLCIANVPGTSSSPNLLFSLSTNLPLISGLTLPIGRVSKVMLLFE